MYDTFTDIDLDLMKNIKDSLCSVQESFVLFSLNMGIPLYDIFENKYHRFKQPEPGYPQKLKYFDMNYHPKKIHKNNRLLKCNFDFMEKNA